jgi:hypothetical protein
MLVCSASFFEFLKMKWNMKTLEINPAIYSRYFKFDKRLFFLLLCLLMFANNYFTREYIVTKDVFYRTFGEQVAVERINQYLNLREKVKWIVFALMPVILLIKISLITLCIDAGTEFADYKVGFKKIFRVVLVAESVFIVATFVRTLGLYFFANINVMQDIQRYSPFSLASIFPAKNFPSWLSYPLLTVNLFEVAYVIVLSLGMSHILQKSFRESLKLVSLSYGLGLLIWMVTIVFLTINFS